MINFRIPHRRVSLQLLLWVAVISGGAAFAWAGFSFWIDSLKGVHPPVLFGWVVGFSGLIFLALLAALTIQYLRPSWIKILIKQINGRLQCPDLLLPGLTFITLQILLGTVALIVSSLGHILNYFPPLARFYHFSCGIVAWWFLLSVVTLYALVNLLVDKGLIPGAGWRYFSRGEKIGAPLVVSSLTGSEFLWFWYATSNTGTFPDNTLNLLVAGLSILLAAGIVSIALKSPHEMQPISTAASPPVSESTQPLSKWEILVYTGWVGFLPLIYLLAAYFLPQNPIFDFGFNQLYQIHPFLALVWFTQVGLLLSRYHRDRLHFIKLFDRINDWLFRENGNLVIFSCVCSVVFFLLRSNVLNGDGAAFSSKILLDATVPGAHVTHDELWEFYLHAIAWKWLNRLSFLTLSQTYQILSILGGGIFVFLLLKLSRQLCSEKALALAGLVACGGTMQLFFGDIENYTLTAVFLMAYYLSAVQYLRHHTCLLIPVGLQAIAITFHLLSIFLIPSMLFLFIVEFQRKRLWQILLAVAVWCGILSLTLQHFTFLGLPLENLYHQSWALGHGGNLFENWMAPFSNSYFWQQINLLVLLFPGALLSVPIFLSRRVKLDVINGFFVIASIVMLIYFFNWNARLGIYNDWNLFANALIPPAILLWSNFVSIPKFSHRGSLLLLFITSAGLHTALWIISNHFSG
jgi:hypothetical protein